MRSLREFEKSGEFLEKVRDWTMYDATIAVFLEFSRDDERLSTSCLTVSKYDIFVADTNKPQFRECLVKSWAMDLLAKD